jgi:hypothetical protein
MKNKKIIIISTIGLLIIGFFSLYNSLDIINYDEYDGKVERDNAFNNKLKKVVPQNIKDFIKNTIFVFKKVSVLERKLADREKQLVDNDIKIRELVENLINVKEFKFKKNEIKNKKLHNINLSLKTFTFPLLKSTGPRSYLSYYNQNLFLITGTGLLLYVSLDDLKNENIVFKRIDTNFKDIIGTEDSNKEYNQKTNIVKHLLIKNNKIYVSYIKKVKDKCFTNAVLVSNLKFEKIIFNQFFDTNECQPSNNIQSGGNLSDYKGDKILMTIGAYGSYENSNQRNNNPQNINSLIGKVISIDETTREYKILSMGHRNSQGLYYDKENNVIYSTDHGPQGGDEINVNTSPDGEIKNYGWGISSYGEHYGFPSADNSESYKLAPLHKSHAKYGFIEPIKYFTPSIAPSQIIKTEKFIKIANKNIIYVGAMGWHVEEGDLSIHQFILDTDLKIEQHNIMPVGERVRDMIYVEELNKIFLFLETSGSIGILEVGN